KFVTMGIWRPIYIKYWNYVDVLGANFIQKSLTDSLAKMSASFVVNSTLTDTAIFKLMFDSTVFFSGRELLTKGANAIRIDFDMTHPKRWWPNGMGAAVLYNLGYQVWFAGHLEAEGHQKIGLRTVELVQEADSIGRSFYLKVNDTPVFIRGANYIPMDHFPSRVTDSMYAALLSDVEAANMNMLRVWGGGIYENDVFYDLCDEKGIMVWQDFMFANAMYPDNPKFFKSVRDEVIQNIVRLRRHPSIVLWCGNNEIEEGWNNWGWAKEYGYDKKDSARIYKNYRKIFHEMIPYSLHRHDTLRPYITSSPKHGWGQDASLTEGDMHYWGVWWGKEPFDMYDKQVGRFMSEYGFQGFPDYSTIEKFTQPSDRYLGSPGMKAHQKHPVGYETIAEYMKRDYNVPTDFKMYGYVSQLLQADGIKTAIDAHRRAKPACMGTLYWQLNDTWPVVSWSSRDYYGNRKALFYAVSRSYKDFFVSPVMDGDTLKVYATFDEPNNQRARLWVVLSDLNGSVLWQEEMLHNFLADRTEVVLDTNLTSFLTGVDKSTLFIYLRIENILGVRATNLYYFVPPKDLKLERAPIDISVKEVQDGYLINLYTTKLAKGVFLDTPVQGDFNDNYFDLLPFEEKNITFFTNKRITDFQDSLEVISLIDTYGE
ncbi:MAG: glycoside hydrolase family 2 protein, partial [Bacteroidia bacterium]|nr:glycoside hydrolase family 2 protein [Bacteroidia bacterium]